MSDPADRLIQLLVRPMLARDEGSLTAQLEAFILRTEVEDLVEQLDNVSSGRFEAFNSTQLLQIFRWYVDDSVICSLLFVEPRVSKFPETVRDGMYRVLGELLNNRTGRGQIWIGAESILSVLKDPLLLSLAVEASCRGIEVCVFSAASFPAEPPLELVLSGRPLGDLVASLQFIGDPSRAAWIIDTTRKFRLFPKVEPLDSRSPETSGAVMCVVDDIESWPSDVITSGEQASIVDLFGDLIVLRDLQPRSAALSGLDELRGDLDLVRPFIPRKNESHYARVVSAFVDQLVGPNAQIIYVGDTLFNDGSVICNLAAQTNHSVFGFLCNEKEVGRKDFLLGPVFIANRWRALVSFFSEAAKRGIRFNEQTVCLFDLDQTVYAAKGRDDEALYQARWEAIGEFLHDIIPSYKFDYARAEQIYRQFDQDTYHFITRDNMDYVVLIVLAVAAGLCDAHEIESFAASQENSIGALTELLHQRALARQGHEDIERILRVIRAVYYNTLAGDQTPCKEFRRYECESTALRMRGKEKSSKSCERIFLNLEVVDFIHFLKDRGSRILALSDRPVEAAIIEEDDKDVARTDLMSIPMKAVGFPIRHLLEGYAKTNLRFQ